MTAKPLIAVDIGNSSFKVGLFSQRQSQPGALPQPDSVKRIAGDASLNALSAWLPNQPCDWCVASVHKQRGAAFKQWVQQNRRSDAINFLTFDQLPLVVDVKEPAAVGLDRLAAAVAASYKKSAHRSAVVVDAGSAITIDLVSVDGEFLGGAILPGISLWSKSLSINTDALPETGLPLSSRPPVLGRSTGEAIASGLFYGSQGAVREIVRQFQRYDASRQSPQIFCTGGDGSNFLQVLEGAYFEPHLVLQGIAVAVEAQLAEKVVVSQE